MSTGQCFQSVRRLLLLSVTLGLLFFNHIAPGLAQGPELFVTDQLSGISIQGTHLYWFSSCGDDFSGPSSYLRVKGTHTAAGSGGQNLYDPVADPACQGSRVASLNVVDDGALIYWLGGDGSVLSLPYNATAAIMPHVVSHLVRSVGGFPSCCSIAVDSTYVYWNEDTLISRVAKIGGPAQTIATGPRIRDLRTSGDGKVFALFGTQLIMLTPSATSYATQSVASNVTAYTLDATRVYYATSSGAAFSVLSQTHGLADTRTHFTGDARTPLVVDNLAVDSANLYWFASHAASGGGRISRFPLAGGTPTEVSTDLSRGSPLLTDGQYLYWTDYRTGIFRLQVNAAPVSAANGSISIVCCVQITQGIQVASNLIPFVSLKTTVVRVFVRSQEDSNGPWTGVTASLTVSGHSRVHGAGPITVSPGGSSASTLTDSFTFLLDYDETALGSRTMTIRISPPPGRTQLDTSGNQVTVPVTFGATRSLTLHAYTYANANNGPSCTTSAPNGVFPAYSNLEAHRQYVENIYPVAQLFLDPYPGTGTQAFDNSVCDSITIGRNTLARLFDLRWPTGAERGVLVQPEQTVPNGACCWGSNGNRIVNIMDYIPNPGPTLGQEIAHSYGGVLWTHTWDAASHYPRTNGMCCNDNDGPLGPYTGVKLMPSLQLIPGLTADGLPAAWDIMSYHFAPPRWISPYTYCKLLNYMSYGYVSCPTTVEGGSARVSVELAANVGATAVPASETSTAQLASSSALETNNPAAKLAHTDPAFLYVAGSIHADGSVTLEPFEMIKSGTDLSSQGQGQAYSVVFEDGSGTVLSQLGFDLPAPHPHPDQSQMAPGDSDFRFGLYLPWNLAVKRITIRSGGKVVAERLVSPNAPIAALTGPASGGTLGGKQNVSWTASDADADKLTTSVWYSPDNAKSWIPLLVNVTGLSATVDFDGLPGSDNALVRILVSDGVNTAEARSLATFKVARKGPQLSLSGPKEGAVFNENQDFVVESTAIDMEDGPITDPAAYSWVDDKDGTMGSGSWIVPHLKPGPHAITVTVKDSSGLTASATLHVTITGTVVVIPVKVTNTITPTSTVTPTVSANCPPTRLVVGGLGRVTPGAANRLRKVVGGDVIGQIPAGGVFKVLDGPLCQGGLLFWHVDFNGLQGWTAEGQAPNLYFVEPYTVPVVQPGQATATPLAAPPKATPSFTPPPAPVFSAKAGVVDYKSTDLNFCPATFQLHSDVSVNGSGSILYQWELIDGTIITKQEAQTFKAAGVYPIISQWIVDKPGSYGFQVRLHILKPNDTFSDVAVVKFTCQGTPG